MHGADRHRVRCHGYTVMGQKKLCMVLIDGLGYWDKVQMSQTVLKLMEINISVFGHSKMGVDPSQGERPKFYSRLDMNPGDASS